MSYNFLLIYCGCSVQNLLYEQTRYDITQPSTSVRCPLVWFTLATFSNVTFYGYKPFYNMSYSLRSSCQGVPLDDSALWIGRHPLPVLEAGTHGEVLRAEAEAAQDPLRV